MVKRGRPLAKTERVEPTPETVIKHHPDPLSVLDPALQRLGHEIAIIHAALSGRVNARTMKWQEGRSPSKSRDPIERIKHDRLADYLDWLKALARERIKSGAIFDMIADMRPPYIVDTAYRLPTGTAGEWLLHSLKLYGGVATRSTG